MASSTGHIAMYWAWEEPRKKTRGNYPIYTNLGIEIKQLKTFNSIKRSISSGASLFFEQRVDQYKILRKKKHDK